MEISYYDLAGGINQASTKTELGLNCKKMYWTDSYNVEILQNKGICKQKGNSLFIDLPETNAVTGLHEMFFDNIYKLIITTSAGNIYVYDDLTGTLTKLEKQLSGSKPIFANFLKGSIIATDKDTPFYLNENLEIDECNLEDDDGNTLIADDITVHKGRVWYAVSSAIYYSALGTYNDFKTENDSGYIKDFHTDTSNIIAIKPYKTYLAIYKKDSVYLLSGTSPQDFSIELFAQKGCIAKNSIINVANKQYFMSNGIFALEQVGELNQIQLGNEISLKIKPEIEQFNPTNMPETFALHYENKSQMWFFFPYPSQNYYHTIWINDYINKAWYKRIIPQDITTGCVYKYNILTGDKNGKIYKEDYGSDFDGKPIEFMWKSPFLALNSPHHRKLTDEFYFILDEAYDNNFIFSVYKDYDSENRDDTEKVYSIHYEHLIWADENTSDNLPCHWAEDESNIPIWAVSRNTLEKAEISESNYSIQLCVEGSSIEHSCAIIGLQFREIYNDD